MEAKDLMQFDWVCLKDDPTPRQVDFIRSGEVGLYWNKIVTPPYIKPILLTPEILEKNGFIGGKYKNYCGKVFYLSVDGFREIGLTMSYKDNILWCERIKPNYPSSIGDKYSIHHLDYVHELQHAMRLCGIEKEIIL